MDDGYTYDEMCPEEAEFIYYEGGESYADDYDDSYLDDYVADYSSQRRYQTHNDDSNSDFARNAAMLGAAYVAGRRYSHRNDLEWERSMAKYRKKWHDDKTGAKRVQSPPIDFNKVTKENVAFFLIVVLVISFLLSLIVGFIIYPIFHLFFDCDQFFCTHDITFGMLGITVTTIIIAAAIILLFLAGEASK